MDALEPPERSAHSPVPLVLVGLVLVVALGTWLKASGEQPAASPSTGTAAQGSPSADGSPTPTPAAVDLAEGPLSIGRYSLAAKGVPFSLNVPSGGWRSYANFSISKSTVGPQGAEAIIYWTGIGSGKGIHPCGQWWGSPVGTIADFAAEAATARGIELVEGPSDVYLGGHTAQHVVFTVRKDVACNPGFFYTWEAATGGAFWTGIDVGDTVRVWLVDIDGTFLYIEADTDMRAGAGLGSEINQIVKSISFD